MQKWLLWYQMLIGSVCSHYWTLVCSPLILLLVGKMCWTWSSRVDHRGIHLTGKFWLVPICLHIYSAFLMTLTLLHVLQYLSRFINTKWQIFDRFAVTFSVGIVWLFAQLLTSSGVYDNKPASTQMSCRTDRSGLLAASPWWDLCMQTIIVDK